MRERVRQFVNMQKNDYRFKTVVVSVLSMLTGFAFVLYNGVLGVVYRSLWHGSICVYYFLLAFVRAIIVRAQRRTQSAAQQRKIHLITHMVLIGISISLFVPAYVMVMGGRSYTYGIIPAITMATYTTYRITMSLIHYRRSRNSENVFVAELRLINVIDSLVAVLTLQNTLIIANGGMGEQMQVLSAWTSGGILILITVIIVLSYRRYHRKHTGGKEVQCKCSHGRRR